MDKALRERQLSPEQIVAELETIAHSTIKELWNEKGLLLPNDLPDSVARAVKKFKAHPTSGVEIEMYGKPRVSEFHPTTKPVELIARMIRNSSRQGELVYDPFCGSGSTLLAAHQLNRIGYGVEIDPGYVAVTLERLSALGLKPELVK